MEGGEAGIVIAPQDAQRRRDGAPARRQDDAGEQHQDVRPGRAGEQIGEAREPGEKARRQRRARGREETGMSHPIRRINSLES